jgi:hypothetical protein
MREERAHAVAVKGGAGDNTVDTQTSTQTESGRPEAVGRSTNYPGAVQLGDGLKDPKRTKPIVSQWQEWLKLRVNSNLGVDGIYGPSTFQVAIWWQQRHPVGRPTMQLARPKGYLGQEMWHSLVNNLFEAGQDDDSGEYDPTQSVEEIVAAATTDPS